MLNFNNLRIDYINRLNCIDYLADKKFDYTILGLTNEQSIGIERPLPNPNLPIDYDKLHKALKYYKNLPWFYIKKYNKIKMLETLLK